MNTIKIGLVGDYNPDVTAHQGIPVSLDNIAAEQDLPIFYEWVPTEEITDELRISSYDGLWCTPSTPYQNKQGALLAIQWARMHNIPFLGTCGGFQHALIEYARNVLLMSKADHAESNPDTSQAVIAQLACALVEVTTRVNLLPDSLLANSYGTSQIQADYRCQYGLNTQFREALLQGPLVACADDETGEVRAVELRNHPFFICTLFQPERAALQGPPSPLIVAFVNAIAKKRLLNQYKR